MALVLSGISEFYTDSLVAVGAVRRANMHMLLDFVEDTTGAQSRRWYYFGTTTVEKPPTTADPVTSIPYVQFPQDLDDLGVAGQPMLFEIAKVIGLKREGVTVLI